MNEWMGVRKAIYRILRRCKCNFLEENRQIIGEEDEEKWVGALDLGFFTQKKIRVGCEPKTWRMHDWLGVDTWQTKIVERKRVWRDFFGLKTQSYICGRGDSKPWLRGGTLEWMGDAFHGKFDLFTKMSFGNCWSS